MDLLNVALEAGYAFLVLLSLLPVPLLELIDELGAVDASLRRAEDGTVHVDLVLRRDQRRLKQAR